MKLIGVVAVSENRCIGYKNKLPWHIPKDLSHFRELTMGNAVIMGRRTYQSLPIRLKGRREIVLSKKWYNDRVFINGIEVYPTIEKAIKQLNKENIDKAFIIGGSEVYKTTMHLLDELYVTVIHKEVNGDKYFPKVRENKFELVDSQYHNVSIENDYPLSFLKYIRKRD